MPGSHRVSGHLVFCDNPAYFGRMLPVVEYFGDDIDLFLARLSAPSWQCLDPAVYPVPKHFVFTDTSGTVRSIRLRRKQGGMAKSVRRYRLFYGCRACVCCGLIGNVLRLEESTNNGVTTCHFNLYARDTFGNDTLMTQDHVIPASLNGHSTMSNLQTMCVTCNESKGSDCSLTDDQRKALRNGVGVGSLISLACCRLEPFGAFQTPF